MRARKAASFSVCLIASALGALTLPGSAIAGLSVSIDRDVAFPSRSLVVTLPEERRLTSRQLRVTEGGGAVPARVTPVDSNRRAKLGVVLAVDASSSMRGPAFDGAIDAARAFSDKRNPRQPLGIVTFGTGTRLLLPFTRDASLIDSALAAPPEPRGGTDMYDAAARSIELVREQELPGGFVVVLSDGTDHGSTSTEAEVVAAARAANVKIFTVGLRSPSFDPEALASLAEQAGGEYSEATSAGELRTIYESLGAQLSNAYGVRYESRVGPGQRVEVRVEVDQVGSASVSYRSPSLPTVGAGGGEDDGWSSPLALALIVGLVACLVALALSILLRGPRQSPRQRVAQFVGPARGSTEEGPSLTGRLAAGAERSLSSAGWWEGFATDVDVAALKYSPGQVVVGSLLAALSLAFVISTVTGVGLLGIAVLVLAPFAMREVVRARARKERKLFGDQLADHLAVVGGSLRVGHSLPAALTAALDEAPEPSRREFARAVTDERLGMPLEDALETVSLRMHNREVEHVALLARLQREAGADAAEMVDQVVATVRERQELRRAVRTLTSQGRLAQVILSVLPGASLLILTVSNPTYVEPLYETSTGHLVLAAAATLVAVGAIVIQRIVKIKI